MASALGREGLTYGLTIRQRGWKEDWVEGVSSHCIDEETESESGNVRSSSPSLGSCTRRTLAAPRLSFSAQASKGSGARTLLFLTWPPCMAEHVRSVHSMVPE